MEHTLNLQNYLDQRANEIDRGLTSFATSASLFSSNRPRMIDQYENKWVAAYKGKVAADADSFSALMKQLEKLGIPRAETMIRHIDREEKTLIL